MSGRVVSQRKLVRDNAPRTVPQLSRNCLGINCLPGKAGAGQCAPDCPATVMALSSSPSCCLCRPHVQFIITAVLTTNSLHMCHISGDIEAQQTSSCIRDALNQTVPRWSLTFVASHSTHVGLKAMPPKEKNANFYFFLFGLPQGCGD